MAVLRVLNATGDTQVVWDEAKIAINDPETEAAIREAERIFQASRAQGATAFRVHPDQPAERIDEFDRHATQIVIVPRLVGGAPPRHRA